MAEYIEKQAAIDALGKEPSVWGMDEFSIGARDQWRLDVKAINAVPPADVRPVVRGEWLKSPECPEEYDICSVCGLNDKHRSRGNAEHPALESVPPFCKWCGADMRPIPELPKEGENERAD